jgi:hypothetical protein
MAGGSALPHWFKAAASNVEDSRASFVALFESAGGGADAGAHGGAASAGAAGGGGSGAS